MQENTVRSFEFAGAGAGPWVPGSAAMRVQSSVDVTVQAVTLIGQTPVDLGTVSAGSSAELSTTHAFVRLVSAGAGSASIAASMPVSTGAGGGGTSDTTEATQLMVKAAVEAVNAKTPALESGRVPVTVQAGLASEVTSAATLAKLTSIDGKLPASLGGKAAAVSLSVTTATGIVTSVGGAVTTGGAAQQLAAANTARRALTVQNTSASELRISPFGTASATAGYRVAAGDLLVLDSPHCGVGVISIWGATSGQTFVGGEAV